MPGAQKSMLAIQGGPRAVQSALGDVFTWPVITHEDEAAVLEVLHQGSMSGIAITQQFEQELAAWFDVKHALCHNTGTAAIQAALYACGVRVGDEVICQSMTYWGSVLQVFSLGGTVVFADMDPQTLTLDPADIAHRITPRTKAIIAVHYCGYPTDMDPLMALAHQHGLKVIEDLSHAHGGLYKGRLLGTIGHVGALSLMSSKALACGEGGGIVTNDLEIYERAVAFGHYERTHTLTHPTIVPFAGMPLGGYKYRMHQLSSAVGRVQLKYYRERMAAIQEAMHYFWDLLEDVPGIRSHRPPAESGSTMGGWYAAHGLYVPEELDELPITRFCEAVRAEGVPCRPGGNPLLHLHPILNDADVYGHGRPTRIAYTDRDVRQPQGSLPVTEMLSERCYFIPWFKHCRRPEIIREHAEAFRKVAECADKLR